MCSQEKLNHTRNFFHFVGKGNSQFQKTRFSVLLCSTIFPLAKMCFHFYYSGELDTYLCILSDLGKLSYGKYGISPMLWSLAVGKGRGAAKTHYTDTDTRPPCPLTLSPPPTKGITQIQLWEDNSMPVRIPSKDETQWVVIINLILWGKKYIQCPACCSH